MFTIRRKRRTEQSSVRYHFASRRYESRSDGRVANTGLPRYTGSDDVDGLRTNAQHSYHFVFPYTVPPIAETYVAVYVEHGCLRNCGCPMILNR